MKHFPLQNIRKTIDDQWDQQQITETKTIPGSADNYIIELIEVPDDGTVNQKPIIQGYTETASYPPPSGQYYINYNKGHIGFNENDAGNVVSIEYYAKGSLIEADDINDLNDRIVSLNQLYTISDTPPSSTIQGYQWFNTNNNILYSYDGLRNKWLSIQKNNFVYGKHGLTNKQYLYYYVGHTSSKNSGLRLIRDACIIGMSGQFSDIGTGTFYLQKNNNTSTISMLDVINDYGNGDTTLNVDVNEGDILHCYFESTNNNIYNPIVIVEIAWR